MPKNDDNELAKGQFVPLPKQEKPKDESLAKSKNCTLPKKETAVVIAEMHGVSKNTVKNAAKAAEKIDTQATDSIIETVNKGAISLNNAAKVAEMPTDTQEAIAEDIEQGTKQKEAINKHVHVTSNSPLKCQIIVLLPKTIQGRMGVLFICKKPLYLLLS